MLIIHKWPDFLDWCSHSFPTIYLQKILTKCLFFPLLSLITLIIYLYPVKTILTWRYWWSLLCSSPTCVLCENDLKIKIHPRPTTSFCCSLDFARWVHRRHGHCSCLYTRSATIALPENTGSKKS